MCVIWERYFDRSIKKSKLLSTVFARSSEAKQGQQLLLFRVKLYKNGSSTTLLHLHHFKNRIGLCLVSNFEGKMGLHLDYSHCLNQPSEPPSALLFAQTVMGSQSAVQIPVYSVMLSVVKFLVLFQKSITQFLSSDWSSVGVTCCYFTQR